MKVLTATAGKVHIGGGSPISVQTMCNTHTCDIEASAAQCVSLAQDGSDLIRLTVQGMNEVAALREIRRRLRDVGFDTPLVADIHFRSDVALEAAKVADKVRVNPGNFNRNPLRADEDFRRLMDICGERGTAIRIGVNHGSLGERITSAWGDSPEGMARAAMEWLESCIRHSFFNVVVSLKASAVPTMVSAYRILQQYMTEAGYLFPTHLGVTEAGNGDAARIKSAVAISALLAEGIGDTVRVSLTENPAREIPVAREILSVCRRLSFERSMRGNYEYESAILPPWEKHLIETACKQGPPILDGRTDTYSSNDSLFGREREEYLRKEILQACRKKFYRPEYVACPGCGRTMFDLEKTFNAVKEATAGMGDKCIAVMGCIVNGPGEMADADFGYVGEGRGLVTIYRGKEPVFRHIPESEAIGKLLELMGRSPESGDDGRN